MSALTWRKEPPDAPGWWWLRDGDGSRPVLAGRSGPKILVSFIAGRCPCVDPRHVPFCEWAGPIPEPEAKP